MKLLVLTLLVVVVVSIEAALHTTCQQSAGCPKDGVCVYPGICRRRCKSHSECTSDECCESLVKLKGRRKRWSNSVGGVCKPLLPKGAQCLTNSGSVKGPEQQCPCKSGLFCEADGGSMVPQGPTGICTPN